MSPFGVLCAVVVWLLVTIADNTAPRPMAPEPPRERDWETLRVIGGLAAVMAGLFGFCAWMDPGPPPELVTPPAIHAPYNPADNPADYTLTG